jgi:hypothetical protein
MKWIAAVFLVMTAAPSFADGPAANEGYCVGTGENCPYAWSQNGRQWAFYGVPVPQSSKETEDHENNSPTPSVGEEAIQAHERPSRHRRDRDRY